MAKTKSVYFCNNCGAESPKWIGRCPVCGEWNTYVEEVVSTKSAAGGRGEFGTMEQSKVRPQRIDDIQITEESRIDLGNGELNRVLGGGLVRGSLVLIGGEPGIGKSTLILQTVLALKGQKILYVSGEESARQLKLRAERIGGLPTVISCARHRSKIYLCIFVMSTPILSLSIPYRRLLPVRWSLHRVVWDR